MKRNLLLLAVMLLAVFGFSNLAMGQCNPNDNGVCDTLYVEPFCGDDELKVGPPYFVRMPIYVTHDIPAALDSLAAFVIPLNYTHTNTSTYCSLAYYWNSDAMAPYDVSRSVFRHLTCGTVTTKNRMNELAEEGPGIAWGTITIDLGNETERFWVNYTPTGGKNRRWWEGSRTLLSTMTFKMGDSTTICMDTTFWPPSSRLAFTRSDAVSYFPEIWDDYLGTEEVCYECSIKANVNPYFSDGEESQTCHINKHYSTESWVADDDDGTIVSVVASPTTLPGVAGIVAVKDSKGDQWNGHVEFDVINHSLAGGTVTLTVTDNNGGQGTDEFDIILENNPPVCTPPDNYAGDYNVLMVSTPFSCTDDFDEDDATMTLVGVSPLPCANSPAIVGDHVEWVGDCCDVCIDYTVTLQCTDEYGAQAEPQTFTVHFENDPPQCTDIYLPGSIPAGQVRQGTFDYTDPQNDVVSAYANVDDCFGVSNIDVNAKTFDFTAPATAGFCTVCLTIVDACGLESGPDECCVTVKITTEPLNQVKIPNKVYERFNFGHWDYFPWQDPPAEDNYIISDDACPPYGGINPGDWFEIPILLRNVENDVEFGAFELEVEFDYIDLCFYGAMRGGLLEKRATQMDVPPGASTFWTWEYFTYRVLPCNISGCNKYKILIYGQADMPDGELRRGYCLTPSYLDDTSPNYMAFDKFWYIEETVDHDTIGAVLCWLKFQVANNELLRDLKLPIIFEWEHKLSLEPLPEDAYFYEWYFMTYGEEYPEKLGYYIVQDWDCAENTFSNCDGNKLYVSSAWDEYAPYNVFNFDEICGMSQEPGGDILQKLVFVDGGVHVCSPCTSFKCVRGDINLDHIAYTAADAVLLARFFVEGINVFIFDRDAQICATDVNADGRTLTLPDLVYLIRVILREAAEIPKLAPSSEVADVVVYNNTITTECASPIGALLFEFDGAVVPTLLANNMEIMHNDNKVLVWSRDGNSIETAAEVLSFAGNVELVSVTAVDRDSRELSTSITAKVAPTTFALNPAYPNPFNPFTNLSFTLPQAVNYSLKIYNVAGQLVRSYEGMGVAGLNAITWDGKDYAGVDVASGVYFFKLTAASFSATQKMVMMK